MSTRNPFHRVWKSLCLLGVWGITALSPQPSLAQAQDDGQGYDFAWFPYLARTYFEYTVSQMQDDAEAFCKQMSGNTINTTQVPGMVRQLVRSHPFDTNAADAFSKAMNDIPGALGTELPNPGRPVGFSPAVKWVFNGDAGPAAYFRLRDENGRILRFTPSTFTRGVVCGTGDLDTVWKLRGTYVPETPKLGSAPDEDTDPIMESGGITLKAGDGFDDAVIGTIAIDLGKVKVELSPVSDGETDTGGQQNTATPDDTTPPDKPRVLLLTTPGFITAPPVANDRPCTQQRADLKRAVDVLDLFRKSYEARRAALRADVQAAFNKVTSQTAYLKALQKEQTDFEAMDRSGPDGERIGAAIEQGLQDIMQAENTLSGYKVDLFLSKKALADFMAPGSDDRKALDGYIAHVNKLAATLEDCTTGKPAAKPEPGQKEKAALFEQIWWQIIRGFGVPAPLVSEPFYRAGAVAPLDKDLVDILVEMAKKATLAIYGKPLDTAPERAVYMVVPGHPGTLPPDCTAALDKVETARARLDAAWKDHNTRVNALRDTLRRLSYSITLQKRYLAALRREQSELDTMDTTGIERSRVIGARVQGQIDIDTATAKLKDLRGKAAEAQKALESFINYGGNYLQIHVREKDLAEALKAFEDCRKGGATATTGDASPANTPEAQPDTGAGTADTATTDAESDGQNLLRPKVTYEATMTINGSVFHIYQGFGISRSFAPDQPNIISIIDNNNGTSQQLFLDLGVYANLQMPSLQLPAITEQENLGSEVVNGYNTTKYHLVLEGPDGYSADGLYWITDQGIAAKTVATQITAAGPMNLDIELSDIKIGPIDPAMFTVPDSLKLTTFPMMGGD